MSFVLRALIDLPSFYASVDFSGSKRIDLAGADGKPTPPRSTSVDVAKLLTKLKQENVSGVILDLRRNGGGLLDEAIKLTGLFIKDGPVVQERDSDGTVRVDEDKDPSVLYDGPLIVLTSRFSASAPEILAGALQDYELLDSGDGLKLERFGRYVFARPESQAMWRRASSPSEWDTAHAFFQPTGEESGGHWISKKPMDDKWKMVYPLPLKNKTVDLRFWAMTTPGRHLGVFPEVAAHWDFMADRILDAGRPLKVLKSTSRSGAWKMPRKRMSPVIAQSPTR